MEKVFWLKMLCRLFYFSAFLLVGIFFYTGMIGNNPGAQSTWSGELLFSAMVLGFMGLLGDVVADIADDIRRRG